MLSPAVYSFLYNWLCWCLALTAAAMAVDIAVRRRRQPGRGDQVPRRLTGPAYGRLLRLPCSVEIVRHQGPTERHQVPYDWSLEG